LDVEYVRVAEDTVPSPTSLLVNPSSTRAEGCVFTTTVNVASRPASLVVRPLVGVTVAPVQNKTYTPLLKYITRANAKICPPIKTQV
jgi:hypothetical protein